MNFKLTPNIAAVLLLVIIVFITGDPKMFLYAIGGYLSYLRRENPAL